MSIRDFFQNIASGNRPDGGVTSTPSGLGGIDLDPGFSSQRAGLGGQFSALDRREMAMRMIESAMSSAMASNNPTVAFLAPLAGGVIGRNIADRTGKARESASNDATKTILEMMNPKGANGSASDLQSTGGVRSGSPVDAEKIRLGLVKRGLPEHVADAFITNFKDESRLQTDINEVSPTVPGSRGGFGLAQWTGPRRKQLEQFAAQRGTPVSDLETQLDFLVYELQGPEKKAASRILSSQNAQDASVAILEDFLRPAAEHMARRKSRYMAGTPEAAGRILPSPEIGSAMPVLPGRGGNEEMVVNSQGVRPVSGQSGGQGQQPMLPAFFGQPPRAAPPTMSESAAFVASPAPPTLQDAATAVQMQGSQPAQPALTPTQADTADPQQLARLMAIIDSPMVSDGQKAIAQQLLMRMTAPTDPMDAIQLEKAQIELDRLRNPQADPMAALERERAQLELDRLKNPLVDPLKGAPSGYMWAEPGNPSAGVVPIPGVKPEPGFRMATPEEASAYGAAAGQIGPDNRFYPINPPSGMSVETGPNGEVRFVQGPGAGSTKFTEAQSKDNVFTTRAEGALAVLDPVASELTSFPQRAAGFDPTGVIRGRVQTESFQRAQQASEEFLQAILRKDTGAAITAQEQELYGKTYLPQPGDSEAVQEQKRISRARAVEALRAGASPEQILAQERALRNTQLRTKGAEAPSGASPVPSVAAPADATAPPTAQPMQIPEGLTEDDLKYLGME